VQDYILSEYFIYLILSNVLSLAWLYLAVFLAYKFVNWSMRPIKLFEEGKHLFFQCTIKIIRYLLAISIYLIFIVFALVIGGLLIYLSGLIWLFEDLWMNLLNLEWKN